MRLFQYISGANDREQPVAMTTPVFMEPDNTESPGQMGFVIPKEVASARIPEPKNDRVQIRQRDGGRFAVFRFAGRMNSATSADAEHALLEWIDKRGWKEDGPTSYILISKRRKEPRCFDVLFLELSPQSPGLAG